MPKEREQGREVRVAFESLKILLDKWADGSIEETIGDWKWILSYSRRYKGAIAYATALGLIGTTLSVVSSLVSKVLLDVITGYQTDKLWLLLSVAVLSTALHLTLGNALSRFNLKLSLDIGNDIQADIFDQIIDADWYAVSQYKSGDLLSRFSGDVSTVSGNAIGWLPSIIVLVYNFIVTFLVILRYDRMMAVLAFAGAPAGFAMSAILMKYRRRYARRAKEMSSRMTSFQVETFYNLDTIKSFGIAPHYGRRLREWQKRMKDFQLDYNLFSIRTGMVSQIFGFLLQGGVFGYCLYRLWTREITYGTMTLFMQQRSKLSGAFSSLVGIIPAFLNASISAHRIRELVDLPREMHAARSGELDAYAADGLAIELRGVSFGYVSGRRVVERSQMIARPGEIVALIGASGEGKTTLIRLILGLIRPESGEAVIRAGSGLELPLNADTRPLLSYVPQGNTILSGTIAENMRMVKEDATDAQIVEALRVACAWDFVSRLPETINTQLGERGRGLSEGQAQRIAIARAVLRDAPVLLLDEATSALDVTTERQVLRSIIRQRPNKTCIVTTHRPSVLSLCRRVYRVMDGRITELSGEESGRMAIDF